MTDTLPAQAPICVACVGDRTNPDGGPFPRCRGSGIDPDPLAPAGIAARAARLRPAQAALCGLAEPVTSDHAGRPELRVGRADVAKARQGLWPLVRGGQAGLFAPVPFGTDVRGRTVRVPLVYHTWLLGSTPRQGKLLPSGCWPAVWRWIAGGDVGARAQGLRRPSARGSV
jgi:hypothetical protein